MAEEEIEKLKQRLKMFRMPRGYGGRGKISQKELREMLAIRKIFKTEDEIKRIKEKLNYDNVMDMLTEVWDNTLSDEGKEVLDEIEYDIERRIPLYILECNLPDILSKIKAFGSLIERYAFIEEENPKKRSNKLKLDILTNTMIDRIIAEYKARCKE